MHAASNILTYLFKYHFII